MRQHLLLSATAQKRDLSDNKTIADFVEHGLSAEGYAVTVARDGNEALAFLAGSGEGVDLVVTDVVLPGPSGVAVAAAARERQSDLPVVFLSGHTAGVLERQRAFLRFLHPGFPCVRRARTTPTQSMIN